MSWEKIFSETESSPAEYEPSNPGKCVVCGELHDLDDDMDFYALEDGSDGAIICVRCNIYCESCGDSVLERDTHSGMAMKFIEGSVKVNDKWYHWDCQEPNDLRAKEA